MWDSEFLEAEAAKRSLWRSCTSCSIPCSESAACVLDSLPRRENLTSGTSSRPFRLLGAEESVQLEDEVEEVAVEDGEAAQAVEALVTKPSVVAAVIPTNV